MFLDFTDKAQERLNLAARALLPADAEAVREFHGLQGQVIILQKSANLFEQAAQKVAFDSLLADAPDELKPDPPPDESNPTA